MKPKASHPLRSPARALCLLSTTLPLLLPLADTVAAQAGAKTPPNVVLVFIDDMGWADFSCFGNRGAQTPQIDRMAREGISFGQFYVNSPICSPSRVAISTGQYPQRWGITSFLARKKQNKSRGMAHWLDPRAPMLARTLKQAGYATGHFGKWHMGGQRDVDHAPAITEYGFDESLTNFEGMGPKLLPETAEPGKDGTIKTGRIWEDAERLGGPATWMQRSEITGGYVNAALGFIDRAAKRGQPFYVNVWPDDVHSPHFPPVENWAEDRRKLYLAVLEEMDRRFAALFDRIRDDPALRSNTLILICSDNGPEKDVGDAGGFRGYKAQLYEGGIRSPLIAWGPGLVDGRAAGTRDDESIFSAIDLAPSLIALAGATPPASHSYDGEELAGTLLGRGKRSREHPLFFSRPPDRKEFYGMKNLPDLAVRDGKWKLLCDYDGSRPELYDLSADPGETNNLAKAHPDLVAQLARAVTRWHSDTLDSEPR